MVSEENMLTYYKELFLYIQKLVQDRDFTSEIVQETYSRTIQAEKKMPIKNKRAFLYRVAKNLIVDESRKASTKHNVEYKEEIIVDESLDLEAFIITQDQSQIIYQLINKLPKKRKQAFVLYAIEGFTRKEIAVKLGVSTNAVEKHITRSIIQIKEEYKIIEDKKEVI
jgi:RNA polymerase sigma-70 factor (ECF subfamily)